MIICRILFFYLFFIFLSLQAPANATELHSYHRGVQMGCWGLVVYAATSAVCSGTTTNER